MADRAADAIRRRLRDGDISAGQRLEPMRELARQLGVGLGVVREAVAQLRAEGLVEVRHGIGTFVTRRHGAPRGLRAVRRRADRREVNELRRALDPVLAETAARRARPRHMADLRLAYRERWRARRSGNAEAFTDADQELHSAITRLAGNGLAAGAQRMASRLLRKEAVAQARRFAEDDRLDALHDALVDAIEGGRPTRARRAAAAIAAIESQPP
ncbi:MAG: FadR/GntR family transcriptional regulator [Candidatus Limnocylindria bacterium]